MDDNQKMVNVIVVLDSGMQVMMGCPVISAPKVVKNVRKDVWESDQKSICIQDYIEEKDPTELMVIDCAKIAVVTIAPQPSNIKTPQKPQLVV